MLYILLMALNQMNILLYMTMNKIKTRTGYWNKKKFIWINSIVIWGI